MKVIVKLVYSALIPAIAALPPLLPRMDDLENPIEMLGCHNTFACCHGYFRGVKVRPGGPEYNSQWAWAHVIEQLDDYSVLFNCFDVRDMDVLQSLNEFAVRGPYKLTCVHGRLIELRYHAPFIRGGLEITPGYKYAYCQHPDYTLFLNWAFGNNEEAQRHPRMRIAAVERSQSVWVSQPEEDAMGEYYTAAPMLVCPVTFDQFSCCDV